MEEAEAFALKETQKYADVLQVLLKNNEVLRQRKEKALKIARMAKEKYLKQKEELDGTESDVSMSTPLEANDVDKAIEEVQAEKRGKAFDD